MKKIFLTACVAVALTACNSTESKHAMAVDKDSTTNTLMNQATGYAPNDGDVTFRNNKVMVYRDTSWKETNDAQTVGSGVVVHTNGVVTNGVQADTLTEGQIVSKTGTFFDASGHVIKNPWTPTNDGVGKTAGRAANRTTAKDNGSGDKNK